MRTPLWLRVSALLVLFSLPTPGAFAAPEKATPWPLKPKLVLVLVFDQFRADYLSRFLPRFLPARSPTGEVGGFRALMTRAAYYPQAQYGLLQAMTGPGHATVLSGAYPYRMGIPTNYWWDPSTNALTYCAQDPEHQTVGAPMSKPTVGTSPKNLVGTTVGDELKNSGHPSRVVSLAVKDRAAILMGGHRADLAVWLDGKTARWVSSSFYLPARKLPSWIESANLALAQRAGQKLHWTAPAEKTGLSTDDPMILQSAWNQRIGNQFPHDVEMSTPASLSTPYGAEITVDLAERALDEFKLGNGKATDLLAVSFSSHDYLAHAFGPNSREMEEMTIAEDRALARLLRAVEKKVPGGLSQTLFVLTADHAGPSNPDWLKAHNVPAGRLDEDQLKAKVESHLLDRFGKPKSGDRWVAHFQDFGIWLNPAALAKAGEQTAAIEREVRALLQREPAIQEVLLASEAEARRPLTGEGTLLARQWARTYFRNRSANAVIVPRPFFTELEDTTSHLTGYAYDRTVPILIGGPGVKPGIHADPADVIDIAPTLSWLLGVMPPASTEGRVLHEALTPMAISSGK